MIHSDAELLLAAGAVLDDLEPAERAAYEAHRGGCLDCRRLELELDHVLADLALTVPERVPPPDLLGGIRRALAAEAASGRPAADGNGAGPVPVADLASRSRGPSTNGPVPLPAARPAPVAASAVVPLRRPSRLPLVAAVGLAAALGVAAVGLGARSAGLEQELQASAARVASLQQALASQGDAVTVAMNPTHVTVALHGDALAPAADAAVMFVPGTTEAYLVARNLPATPSGHGYQLWYADGSGVHPLQTVSYDGTGTFVAPIGVDLADSAAVMITLEESGGAQGAPGPQVVFGEL